MAFTAVVFDLDGTLVDSAPDLHVAANRMLADFHAPPLDLETVIGFIGKGVEVLVRRSLDHRGLDLSAEDRAAALASFRAHYSRDLTTLTRLYPGVEPMLGALSARVLPLGVCTNKPETPARDMCATLRLARYLKSIVGGDTLPVRKPDPAPLLRAICDLGADAGSTLYVGDSETDYATARAAGVAFAYFEGGYQRRPIPDFAPEFRVTGMAEIADLV